MDCNQIPEMIDRGDADGLAVIASKLLGRDIPAAEFLSACVSAKKILDSDPLNFSRQNILGNSRPYCGVWHEDSWASWLLLRFREACSLSICAPQEPEPGVTGQVARSKIFTGNLVPYPINSTAQRVSSEEPEQLGK